MTTPKHHLTKGGQGRRRSHLGLKKLNLVPCDHCGKPKLSHIVCSSCGYYKGKEVFNPLARELKKKEKRKQEK